jgi:nucleotide-binding universal stress UspA family protein
MKLSRVLVGIDFSEEAEIGRAQAIELAARHGAQLRLLHAFAERSFWPGRELLFEESDSDFDDLVARELTARRDKLLTLEKVEQYPDLETSSVLVEGNPDTVLAQQAEAWNASLVVVGTHGRTGLRRLRLGSVAERTIRRAPCSVLVARPRRRPEAGFRRVLVPTDFSSAAEQALRAAVALTDSAGEIDVLYSWQIPFGSPGAFNEYQGAKAHRARLSKAAAARGAKLLRRYEEEFPQLAFFDTESPPVGAILDRLDEHGYDLVVMGSHSRRGLRRLVLGSVAEAVTRHAPCSVMVVR